MISGSFSNFDRFQILDTNTNLDKEKPDIFCYTEIHTRADHKIKIAQSILQNYKEGDVILVEGVEGELSETTKSALLEEYKGLPKNSIIRGWDPDDTITTEILDRISSCYDITKKMQINSCTSEKFKFYLQRIVKKSGIELSSEEETFLKQKKLVSNHSLVKTILIKSYNALHKSLSDEAEDNSFLQRNKFMAKTIAQNKTKTNAIHIIAGAKHLTHRDPSHLTRIRELNRTALTAVRSVIEKHKYVILKPDEKPIEITKEDKETSFLKKISKLLHRIIKHVANFFGFEYNNPHTQVVTTTPDISQWEVGVLLDQAKEIADNWGENHTCPCEETVAKKEAIGISCVNPIVDPSVTPMPPAAQKP